MDEPSRSPYRLDLDNGPVQESDRILETRAGFRRLRFSFFRQELTFPSGERTLGFGPVAQAVRAHA